MIGCIDKFIDNTFWQETLLLALRALPNKQTLKVLEYILKRDEEEIAQYFYHNHYFVMKFIAEQGKWLDDRGFVEKQVIDFFDFSLNDGKGRSNTGNRTWKRFQNMLSSITDSLVQSTLSEKLLSLVEEEKQSGDLRRDCVVVVGETEFKDRARVERLLGLAEDEKQAGDLRRACAETVGKLGEKQKTLDILVTLYISQKDKYSIHAQKIYNSLWDLTAI
jgi:hypothetical protein